MNAAMICFWLVFPSFIHLMFVETCPYWSQHDVDSEKWRDNVRVCCWLWMGTRISPVLGHWCWFPVSLSQEFCSQGRRAERIGGDSHRQWENQGGKAKTFVSAQTLMEETILTMNEIPNEWITQDVWSLKDANLHKSWHKQTCLCGQASRCQPSSGGLWEWHPHRRDAKGIIFVFFFLNFSFCFDEMLATFTLLFYRGNIWLIYHNLHSWVNVVFFPNTGI